jgi:hypothetical protein
MPMLNPAGDISVRDLNQETQLAKASFERFAATVQAGVLGELASGTGGTFTQNTNDMDGAYRISVAQ